MPVLLMSYMLNKNKSMKYLYLKPSVYIWRGQNDILFYDSESYKKCHFSLNDNIISISDKLLDISNLYSVAITSSDLQQEWIIEIIANNLATVVDSRPESRPVAIPPVFLFNNRAELANGNSSNFYDPYILEYISTVTIRLSGNCDKQCVNCAKMYKQVKCCTKEKVGCLGINELQSIYEKIKSLKIQKLELIFTDMIDKTYTQTVLSIFSSLSCFKIIYINSMNVTSDTCDFLKNYLGEYSLKLIFDCQEILHSNTSYDIIMSSTNVICDFLVSSNDHISFINKFITDNNIKNYEVNCIYNGENIEFLNSHYFLNQEDLLGIELKSNDINANQVMNSSLWGQLIIDPDSTIRFNENDLDNQKIIGSLYEFLQKNFVKPDFAWLKIRNTGKCVDCVYKYLCPPISNVELFMNRISACCL